jgi:hypothetical protein
LGGVSGCFLPGLLGHALTDTVGYWNCFYGAQEQDWRITAVFKRVTYYRSGISDVFFDERQDTSQRVHKLMIAHSKTVFPRP